MKSLLALPLLIAAPLLAADISIGIQIGPPPPPPRVIVVPPPAPEPEAFWVQGYWYPVGKHYKWHAGYWTRPPYVGAVWVAPRYDGGRFFEGYWEGDRGRRDHDHHWDHRRERDWDDDHDHGHGRGRGHH